MDYNSTFEMQIKSSGEEAFKVLEKICNTLTKTGTETQKVSTKVDANGKLINATLTSVNKEGNKLYTTLQKIGKDGSIKYVTTTVKELGDASVSTFSKLKSALGGVVGKFLTFQAFKRLGLKIMDFLDSSVNRAEELNLFNVIFKNVEKDGVKTFSTLGREAYKFQNKLNEAFGTNMTETLRYQGLFQAMATNAGIAEKDAALMSETMVKLTYDLASLYNTDEKTTAEALRAGVYAGQTKPLRKYGIDVTQTSAKPIMAALGITDRSFNEMSQAEKQILRYIATLRQAQSAMGDFAQTIESPANQLKIFKQQLIEVKTAWGNLFMGMYAQILPYANAILMVLKEIAKAIANIFGLSTSDYNTGIGSLEEIYDGFEDIGTGAGNATKAAKELKRQVLGFDQINNLTSPSKSGSSGGSGSGGGVTGGIDKRLIDALSGYDNLMDKVRMKANDIRDRWLQILGFQKVINPLTGETEFKYQGFSKTIEGLAKWFGNLSDKGKLFVTLGLEIIFGKIFTAVSKLAGGLLNTDTAMGKFLSNVGDKITTVVKGLGIALTGALTLNAALEDMKENGINAGNQIAGLGGSLMTMLGAAQIGSVFGPVGALIGGIAGGVYSLIEAIKGIGEAADIEKNKIEKAKDETLKTLDEWQQGINDMKASMQNSDDVMDYYANLKSELDSIVDKNGKIKKGYEDRAATIVGILSEAFGIEIEIVDGTIKKYDELQNEIDELIKQKRAMAKLNALEEQYNTAISKQTQAKKDLAAAEKYLNDLIFDQNELVKHTAKEYDMTEMEMKDLFDEILNNPMGVYSDDLREAAEEYGRLNGLIDDQTEVYHNNIEIVENYQDTIKTFETAYGLSLKKDWDALDEFTNKEAQLLGESTDTKKKFWKDERESAEKHLKELADNRDKYSKEEYDKLVEADKKKIKNADDYFYKLDILTRTKNGEISKEVVDGWIKMGEESTDKALLEFQKLPSNIQDKLQWEMALTGTRLGEELNGNLAKNLSPSDKELKQKSLNIVEQLRDGMKDVKLEKTITVKAKDEASNTINNLINKYKNNPIFAPLFKALNKETGGVFSGGSWRNIPQYANGGLPSHGTLFAAGENGAEIVGNINRRTEVLNRSQIASAIYTAVSDAMRNSGGGTVRVDLHAHTDEGVVIDKINQKTKQTGVCPINIPA